MAPKSYELVSEKVINIKSYLWVGIGCQRGTSCEFISAAIKHVFQENNLLIKTIAGVATINTKALEPGITQFCALHNLPLVFFTAEELQNVTVPNPSQIVANKVQTLSVAEAAAILATNTKTLFIPKQIICSVQGLKGAVTLAVSLATNDKRM